MNDCFGSRVMTWTPPRPHGVIMPQPVNGKKRSPCHQLWCRTPESLDTMPRLNRENWLFFKTKNHAPIQCPANASLTPSRCRQSLLQTQRNTITFKQLISTRMFCATLDGTPDIGVLLVEKTYDFEFGNNHLYLKKDNKNMLTLKHVD